MQYQVHDQVDVADFRRELWLNQRTIKLALALGLNIEENYRTTFDLTYSQLAALSFGAYATASDVPAATFDPATWNQNQIALLPIQVIEAYFRLSSLDYAQFKAKAMSPKVAPFGYEAYALSPLARWPLIRRSDGLAVAPLARDLLERPTRAFMFDVYDTLGKDNEADRSRFGQAQGEAYEEYVGGSLKASRGCGDVSNGAELLPTNVKNCDFVCLEEGAVTLVESKAVSTALEANITKDRDMLIKEFSKGGGVVDGLIQLNESALSIRRNKAPLIAKNALLNAVLVLHGEQVFLNSPLVHELLENLVLKKSQQKMIVKFQVINDIGFASVVRYLRDSGSLARFLYEKRSHKIEASEEFHHTVYRRSTTLPPHPLNHLGDSALDKLGRHFAPTAVTN
jgi:hypothetical protein